MPFDFHLVEASLEASLEASPEASLEARLEASLDASLDARFSLLTDVPKLRRNDASLPRTHMIFPPHRNPAQSNSRHPPLVTRQVFLCVCCFLSFFGCLFFVFYIYLCIHSGKSYTTQAHRVRLWDWEEMRWVRVDALPAPLVPRPALPQRHCRQQAFSQSAFIFQLTPFQSPPLEQSPPPNHPPPPITPNHPPPPPPPLPKSSSNHTCRQHRFFVFCRHHRFPASFFESTGDAFGHVTAASANQSAPSADGSESLSEGSSGFSRKVPNSTPPPP